jgi:small subunit ribosomal protein S17
MTTDMTKPSLKRRRLRGTVVSTKMQKAIVVRVDRHVTHPIYKKAYVVSKRYKVREPAGVAHVGDLVEFEECRPLSSSITWRYVQTLKAAIA